MLQSITEAIMKIYIKGDSLYILFAPETAPDKIDFFVRNVSVLFLSPQGERKYSNPMSIAGNFDNIQYIEKIGLHLTTTVPLGGKRVLQIRKTIEAGDAAEFYHKRILLGNFNIRQG